MAMNKTRVILPEWIWNNATNNEEFKQNLSRYMLRYPGYRILEVGKHYAICEVIR